MASRKPGKAMPALPNDFIALGAKSQGGSVNAKAGGSSGLNNPGGPLVFHPKKPKVSGGGGAPGGSHRALGGVSGVGGPGSSASNATQPGVWESIAREIDPVDLVGAVTGALNEDPDRAVAWLCGAVRQLRALRAKPDQVLYLSLLYLAKHQPELFSASEHCVNAFCSLLKRDVKESYKSKGNALVAVLAANILLAAFQKERHWPEIFVRVFIDDAIGERIWVDHPDCKGFVDNVMTALGTRMPPQSVFLKPEGGREQCPSPPVGGGSGSGSGSATPTRVTDDDSLQGMESGGLMGSDGREPMDVGVMPRYQGVQNVIEHIVMEVVREHLNRRQGSDNITRNFLRFLTSACGLPEVRLIVMSKIEMWVMSPKVSKIAQELLTSVALNCNTHTQIDIDVLGHFAKLRFKNKPNINLYLHCIRELSLAHNDNLPTIIKHTIFNELSNARNTNNMGIINVIFTTEPERAASSLASVFMDLLLQKEDYLRALRALLREIVRALRYDINLQCFCAQLMQERPKEAIYKDFEPKDRLFTNLTDIIVLSMFLGISPQVREVINGQLRNDKKDTSPLKAFLKQVSLIQRDAMWWFLDMVPKYFVQKGTSPALFAKCLHKILFMTSHDEYFLIDGWPGEVDRHVYFKAIAEVPLHQDTLMRILQIGLNKNLPLNGRDTIDLAEFLVKRAANLYPLASEDFQILASDKPNEIIEWLFQLAAYVVPDSIPLPQDYSPPSLAISTAYWKVWNILTVYCAYNPSEYGANAWETYPSLRAFMEMCMTNQFVFPPPTIASGEEAEALRAQEVQSVIAEKEAILTFENHLAQDTITESNSLLLPQLITLNPDGPLRRPPQAVLEALKGINSQLRIGHLLCRSRNPDFLLDILQRQGTSQAMPWLADLVESSEGSLNVLPVQCLCEFLLNSDLNLQVKSEYTDEMNREIEAKKHKQRQLLQHLQSLLQNSQSDPRSCFETLDYFLRRLSSHQTHQRLQALKGLKMILTPYQSDETLETGGSGSNPMEVDEALDDNKWLLHHLTSLPFFDEFFPHISAALRTACQVENEPNVVGLYMQFLCRYRPSGYGDETELCLDMASIIVERSTILPAILLGPLCKSSCASETFYHLLYLFTQFMKRTRDPANSEAGPSGWSSENQAELITVVWGPSNLSATLHFFVVHAQIILLTFQPDEKCKGPFQEMLQVWFPPDLSLHPKAFLVDTREEAVLIPDWLKLKMIRSDVSALVDAALNELEASQLILFIQSFGIPVASMSKLLQALDVAVRLDSVGVNEAVLDKNYMGQLVAVQHRRGATGGHVFANALHLQLHTGEQREQTTHEKMAAVGRLSEPIIPPRSTAMIPPGHVRNTLLHLFDVGSPSRMTMKEKQDTFRTLQKFLAREISDDSPSKPILEAIVKALDSILKSDLRSAFVQSMAQRTAFSCGLFRLISSSMSRPPLNNLPTSKVFIQVGDILVDEIALKGLKSPLTALVENYKQRMGILSEPEVKEEPLFDPSTGSLDEEVALNKLSRTSTAVFETQVKQMVKNALKRRSTGPLVNSMSQLLLQEAKEKQQIDLMERKGMKIERELDDKGLRESEAKSKVGLLVDWLELLDPELIQVSPEIQQQLLFSKCLLKSSGVALRRERSAQPYLLSMLTHQASWNKLRETIDYVLRDFDPGLDAEAVLDFLSSCILIPKLWHGRDKHLPKHETPQDVLALTWPQLAVMIDYLLQEAHDSAAQDTASIFRHRIPLVIRCLNDAHKARAVVDYLILKLAQPNQRAEDEKRVVAPKTVVQELLLQIYMKMPSCLLHLTDAESHLPRDLKAFGNTSVVDTVAHTLLSALSATQHGRQWGVQMLEFESAIRKLTSSHPLLMLRNVPLIAASLKGRTDYDFSFFRSRNHMTLYNIALGLLELLKPYVFRPEYQEPLQAALGCYFDMLGAYFHRRDSIFGLIDKFLTFLHDYLAHQPQTASKFIVDEGQILPELASAMPNMNSLKQLVACINFAAEGVANSTTGSNYALLEKREAANEANRLLNNLSLTNLEEDIAAILLEVNNLAVAKPIILEHFVDETNYYLSHPSKGVRNQAYNLLLKLLRSSPKSSRQVVLSYIGCLESGHPAVIQSALEKLPDIAVLCEERLCTILQTVFALGLYSNMSVTQYIMETVAVLNARLGY